METLAFWILAGLAWAWHASMRARELALDEARYACVANEVRWLDDTVSIKSTGLQRDEQGRWRLRRIYGFRYLEAEHLIREGVVILLGDRVQVVLLDTSRLDS
ncbi:MAG: DUF3301 domain-containing protein [Magnetococcales bacterium]|nr:DUF3301 domain-containing protein [Magnetococcales bacterium]